MALLPRADPKELLDHHAWKFPRAFLNSRVTDLKGQDTATEGRSSGGVGRAVVISAELNATSAPLLHELRRKLVKE